MLYMGSEKKHQLIGVGEQSMSKVGTASRSGGVFPLSILCYPAPLLKVRDRSSFQDDKLQCLKQKSYSIVQSENSVMVR